MACDPNMCDPALDVDIRAVLTIASGAVASAGGDEEDPVESAEPMIGPNMGRVAVNAIRFSPDTVAPGSRVTLEIDVEPDANWHFYGAKEEIGQVPSLAVTPPDGLTAIGGLKVPDGIRHESYGIASYWVDAPTTLTQEFQVADGATEGTFAVPGVFTYMACDPNICDEAVDVDVRAVLTVRSGAVTVAGSDTLGNDSTGSADPATGKVPGDVAAATGDDIEEGDEEDQGTLAFLLLAVGAGLLALVMPCTYPMIPITISFFTKQASDRGGSVLPLALTYGAGIIAIFIAIGLAIGPAIVPFATHPITNLVIGIVFVIFALSLFGLIHLNPPEFLMRGAGAASRKGGYLGVFLMGTALVITSFTCTMPFVGTLLAVGAKTGDVGRVALGMGAFGATMAIPFVLLSLLPGRIAAMPKSGGWLGVMKVTLGFVELAAALKFFSNAEVVWKLNMLPRELFLALWAAIFVTATLYLLGFIKLEGDTTEIGPGRLVAGVGAMLLTFYFAYGSLGYRLDNVVMLALEPPYTAERVGALAASGGNALANADRHEIVKDDFDEAVRVAKERNLAVMINFTGYT